MAVDFAQGGSCILNELIKTGQETFEGGCISGEVAAAIKEARENKSDHLEASKAMGLSCRKSLSIVISSEVQSNILQPSPALSKWPFMG